MRKLSSNLTDGKISLMRQLLWRKLTSKRIREFSRIKTTLICFIVFPKISKCTKNHTGNKRKVKRNIHKTQIKDRENYMLEIQNMSMITCVNKIAK